MVSLWGLQVAMANSDPYIANPPPITIPCWTWRVLKNVRENVCENKRKHMREKSLKRRSENVCENMREKCVKNV